MLIALIAEMNESEVLPLDQENPEQSEVKCPKVISLRLRCHEGKALPKPFEICPSQFVSFFVGVLLSAIFCLFKCQQFDHKIDLYVSILHYHIWFKISFIIV